MSIPNYGKQSIPSNQLEILKLLYKEGSLAQYYISESLNQTILSTFTRKKYSR